MSERYKLFRHNLSHSYQNHTENAVKTLKYTFPALGFSIEPGLSKYYKDTQTTQRRAKTRKDVQRHAKKRKDRENHKDVLSINNKSEMLF